jgi:hypothetical protein
VTAAPGIIQADRVRWQRQAAGELARILDAHPGLPAIAWTVGAAGCVLAGRVNGLAPAGQVRDVFDAWRAALALEEHREHQLGGGATWLHAAARRDLVRVRLTATVFAGEEDDR